VQAAPDASGGFCGALDVAAFQRFDFGAGGIEEEGNLFLDASDLETVERYDFVSVVHWGRVSLGKCERKGTEVP